MGKKIKMVLYGEPGVGKSVFASKAPHPFFVTTDGNYEWLEDFGAKEEDHIQSTSWAMTKKIIKDIRDNPEKYEKYETLVMDLLEDNFKWCEYEYCASGHLSLALATESLHRATKSWLEICHLVIPDSSRERSSTPVTKNMRRSV